MKNTILKKFIYLSVFALFFVSCSNRSKEDTNTTAETSIKSIRDLGKALFFDKSFSLNKTQTCATFHDTEHAFIDPRDNGVNGAVSLGDDGSSLGDRNAPTVTYAMFSPQFHFDSLNAKYIGGQFLDGRAKDLKEQAGGPPINPIEMGMPDIASVVKRIKENDKYVKAFKTFFSNDIFDDANKTYDAFKRSIAEFEKSKEFAPFNSKYDKYLEGKYTLTDQEKKGMDLFFADTATSCVRCHTLKKKAQANETFTNYEYHNIGTPINTAVRYANSLPLDYIDHGLLDNPEVNDSIYDGKFKVPTLRNISVTGPYMHNGVFQNLRTVLEFYDHFNNKNRKINPETNLPWREAEVKATVNHKDLRMQTLTDDKIDALLAFLNLLTDEKYEHLIPNKNRPEKNIINIGNIDDEPLNDNCPGKNISELNAPLSYIKINATAAIDSTGDIDIFGFDLLKSGTLSIEVNSSQPLSLKVSNSCEGEKLFGFDNKTDYKHKLDIGGDTSIFLKLYDNRNFGFEYNLSIEFIPKKIDLSDINITFERFTDYTFTMPIGLIQAPNSNDRYYVPQLNGKVEVFNQKTKEKKTFIDISKKITSGGEQGLLGMAFHPLFPAKAFVYLSYTDLDGNSVISRFTSNDGGLSADANSQKIILTLEQPYDNHNGGNIAFGPDGYLYIGFGDGGSSFDPQNNAQNRKNLLGAMLRIDIDKGDPYDIPDDNPFFGNPKAKNGVCESAMCPEIYAWGLRNPWRWSFDKQYKRLWVGDVGQDNWEEVDIVEKGKNYGWNCKEGKHFTDIECQNKDFTDPILEYDHDLGFAITGGYVYRGNDIPSLKGVYLYADYVTGLVWGYFPNSQTKLLAKTDFSISSFGEGNDAKLYIVDFESGNLYKIKKE